MLLKVTADPCMSFPMFRYLMSQCCWFQRHLTQRRRMLLTDDIQLAVATS